jgi:hypothetical protein
MDSIKQASSVASTIIQSHMGTSDWHSLFEKHQYKGQALASNTSNYKIIQQIPGIFQHTTNSWHHTAQLCNQTNRYLQQFQYTFCTPKLNKHAPTALGSFHVKSTQFTTLSI